MVPSLPLLNLMNHKLTNASSSRDYHVIPFLSAHVDTSIQPLLLTANTFSPSRLDAWNRSRFLRDLLFSCFEPLRSLFSRLSPVTVLRPRYVLANALHFVLPTLATF